MADTWQDLSKAELWEMRSADAPVRDLGTAVVMLEGSGEEELASLLETCELSASLTYDGWAQESVVSVGLSVDPTLFLSFDESVQERLKTVFRGVYGEPVDLTIHPRPVQKNWREQRAKARAEGITNQGVRIPLPETHPVVDGMHFLDSAEVAVYRALKNAQAKMPKHKSIAFTPNVPVCVRDRIMNVDFVVAYGGRVGVLEVDGDTHRNGRYTADSSRDGLLTDAGFQMVYRIAAEDSGDAKSLEDHLRTFLQRLTR